MKKVLILAGSPRHNGNSSTLAKEFKRGATDAGHSVEWIDVAKMNVKGCLGCNACYRNDGSCIQKDDMTEIREKMIEADVIVLASPIYFYSMTAQLKAVIDRTYPFYESLSGKEFYYIITCGADSMEYTETMLAALRGFTCCIPNAKEAGVLYGIGVNEPGEIKNSDVYAKAYEMGKQL